MLKRIIPCLDTRGGRVVKGVNFEDIRDLSDPVELAAKYNADGADELVLYDITASNEGRKIFEDLLKRVALQVTIPLTVGGGLASISDCDAVLACGADKVSINSRKDCVRHGRQAGGRPLHGIQKCRQGQYRHRRAGLGR
jgi:cyclase